MMTTESLASPYMVYITLWCERSKDFGRGNSWLGVGFLYKLENIFFCAILTDPTADLRQRPPLQIVVISIILLNMTKINSVKA